MSVEDPLYNRGLYNRGLSRLVSHAGRSLSHNPQQFHGTPSAGTICLMIAERARLIRLGRKVWEPACGAGDMGQVLASAGFDVVATDIADRGYGEPGIDFLKERQLRAPIIICNPPFGESGCDFIRHAMRLRPDYMALLLPIGFFTPTARSGRDDLWRAYPPTRVWPLGFRLDFTGGGRPPALPLAWFIWDDSQGRDRQVDRVAGAPYAQLMPPLRRPDPADDSWRQAA